MITIEINNGSQKLMWATEDESASLTIDVSATELRIRKAENKHYVISEEHRRKMQEGRKQAEEKGTKFGRKLAFSYEKVQKLYTEYLSGDSIAMLSSKYKVCRATISRTLRNYKAELQEAAERMGE